MIWGAAWAARADLSGQSSRPESEQEGTFRVVDSESGPRRQKVEYKKTKKTKKHLLVPSPLLRPCRDLWRLLSSLSLFLRRQRSTKVLLVLMVTVVLAAVLAVVVVVVVQPTTMTPTKYFVSEAEDELTSICLRASVEVLVVDQLK